MDWQFWFMVYDTANTTTTLYQDLLHVYKETSEFRVYKMMQVSGTNIDPQRLQYIPVF